MVQEEEDREDEEEESLDNNVMEDTVTQQLFTAPASPEETNSSSYYYPYSLSPHQPVTDANPTATAKATTFTLPLRTNNITMSSTNSDKVSDSLSPFLSFTVIIKGYIQRIR